MHYPENIEAKLGFDIIRQWLEESCLGPLGAAFVRKIKFSNDFQQVKKRLDQTAEFLEIIQENLPFPNQNFLDVNPLLDKLRPEASFVSPEEFRDIRATLETIRNCLDFFASHKEDCPNLFDLSQHVRVDKNSILSIDKVIDEKGVVRSSASRELSDIRGKIHAAEIRLRRELEKALRTAQKEGYTDEDLSITLRNGRMVIPVRAEHKRTVKGFIQDESASGQTVFIEPAETLEVNNEIRELGYAERREMQRLLQQLADTLRPLLPDIRKASHFLGIIDFVRAKAKLAFLLEATLPQLEKSPEIKISGGKHPLLFLSHKKQGKPVVPLAISIDASQRIVLISGPNAGGKSIALKTVGLLQYMLQCGLLPPVNEGSVMGIFDDIFIDIGDEQSVENDLSTYSSHLRNIREFLFFGGKKSLILIDEFGTGTEPTFGGAIAEAVLEQLNKQKVMGVITTHYGNLKTFAEHHEGVVNAAMLYDTRKLEPMYILETGTPGSSFAIEIASKTGLPAEVIESAKEKAGTTQVEYDQLIHELEIEKSKYRRELQRVREKEKQVSDKLREYSEQKEFLDTHRKKLMNEAKQQAKILLHEANQKIEQTIREIKEHQAEKESTRKLREQLQEYQEQLKPEKVTEPEPMLETETGEIKPGDAVKLIGQEAYGEVLSVHNKEVEILIGALKSKVKLQRLQKISRREFRSKTGTYEPVSRSKNLDLSEKFAGFSPNLDVRGMRVEEVLPHVDTLIDNAILFGANELRIIHGKGNGILRSAIREHLRKYAQVKTITDEHADRGGAGVSLVTLRD